MNPSLLQAQKVLQEQQAGLLVDLHNHNIHLQKCEALLVRIRSCNSITSDNFLKALERKNGALNIIENVKKSLEIVRIELLKIDEKISSAQPVENTQKKAE